MYIPFEDIADSARVWIYQAGRKLTDQEIQLIAINAQRFCDNWAAHNTPLKSSYHIYHDQFVVLAVDEGHHAASGCSIDTSVALMRQIEDAVGTSFFDRTQIAFVTPEGVLTTPMGEIKEKISVGKISKDTLTFNNLVKDVGELKSNWKVPAGDSWLKRYF